MLRLGNLTLDAPFYQAGLAGYSDAAMRLVARRHGAPYAVTEAMLDQFLIRGGKGLRAAALRAEDHPIAGQLIGAHPAEIAQGAKILAKLGYDVIDVNLACPVKKVRRKCRGGHLLASPHESLAILDAVRQAVPAAVPCTVKLRRASDDSAPAEANFRIIFEAALNLGYAGATIHGRTVEQKYHGVADWEFLRRLVGEYGRGAEGEERRARSEERGARSAAVARTLPAPQPETRNPKLETAFLIGGSGDIWTAADIFRMLRATGVDLVSVARGCIGNPWIFTQARALLAGDAEGGCRAPTLAQQRAVLLEHFGLSVSLHGEDRASVMMRKFGIKFARHHPQAGEVAKAFIAVESVAAWHAVLEQYYAVEEVVAA